MEAVIQHKGAVVVPQRNVEIVIMYANGIPTKTIAKKFKMSIRGIESVVSRLRKEFDCKSISHLVATFFRKGLIN